MRQKQILRLRCASLRMTTFVVFVRGRGLRAALYMLGVALCQLCFPTLCFAKDGAPVFVLMDATKADPSTALRFAQDDNVEVVFSEALDDNT
jgi:hypothetical protein